MPSGLDIVGPFHNKNFTSVTKGYLYEFVCFSTEAISLEAYPIFIHPLCLQHLKDLLPDGIVPYICTPIMKSELLIKNNMEFKEWHLKYIAGILPKIEVSLNSRPLTLDHFMIATTLLFQSILSIVRLPYQFKIGSSDSNFYARSLNKTKKRVS